MSNGPIRVLVVDDEPAHAEAVRRALVAADSQMGVEVAHSLKEFRQAVAVQKPDLVLLDFLLPDGRADSALISPPESGPFPMVVMTSHGDEQVAVSAIRRGALDYVVKSPSAFADMPRTVERTLREWRTLQETRKAQAALRENERQLATLMANLPGMAYRCQNTPDWPMVFVSEGCAALTGYTAEALQNNQPAYGDTIVPEDRQYVWDAVQTALQKRQPFEFTYRIQTATSQFKWVWERGRGVFRAKGELLFLEGFITDITERKQSEEALQTERQRLASIIHGANVGTWEWNVQTGETRFNERWAEMIGYTLAELTPITIETWVRFAHPDDLKVSNELLQKHFRGELENYECEARLRHRDGHWIWVIDRGRVTSWTTDGKPLMMQGTHSEITRRKRAEDSLRDREALLTTIFNLAADTIALLDVVTGRFVEFNNAAHELLGYTREEFARLHLNELQAEHTPEMVAANIKAIREQGRLAFETQLKHRNGTLRDVAVRTTWLTIQGRDYISSVWRDITEQKRAQQEIAEREKRFRTLFEENGSIMFVIEPEKGTILDANQAAVNFYGYSREQLLAMNISQINQLSPEQIRVERQAAARQQRNYFVFPHRLASGEVRMVEVYSTPVSIQNQQLLVSIVHDVTEQHRALAALRESEEQMRLIGDNLPESFIYRMIQAVDGVTKFVYVSRSVEKVVGFSAEKIIQEADLLFSRLAVEFQAAYAEAVEVSRRDLTDFEMELQVLHGNGEWRWCRVNSHPHRQADGATVWDGVTTDITEQKRNEEATKRLMVAIDQSVEGIMFTDLDGRLVYLNSGYEKICGYTRAELIGRKPAVLRSGKHSQEFYRELWQTITRGKVWRGRFINRHKSGALFEEDTTITPIRNVRGEITSYVATKHDVTREAALERQLIEAQKMEAVGQLAGGVAHDFNNILASIMMQLGLMRMVTGVDDEVARGLSELDAAARRASALTGQLLMFSRRSVLAVKTLDLNEVVANLLKMLGRLIGEQIELNFHGKAGLSAIEADIGMMEQVLMNLVVNARDAMPKGGSITINTAVAEMTEADLATNPARACGRFVCLSVTDTGTGMDDATAKRIFEPFFTTKAAGKGTGLGLATVHGIVAQHKGWVEVQTQVGTGTTFRVYLPAIAETVAPVTQTVTAGPLPRGKETILVVEDESKVLKVLGKTLRMLGYQVHEATNGQEAMKLWQLHGHQIDLLLTDMVMPEGMTGLELVEKLQELKPGLRAIISSGYSAEIVQAGVPDRAGIMYLPKPYPTQTLADVVRRSLAPSP